ATQPQAALAQTRAWLAAGGLLLLTERHPDWCASLLEGLDSSWWREDQAGAPVPALLQPATWLQTLNDAGFAECEALLEPAAEGLAEGAYLLLAKRPVEAIEAQQHLET